MKTFIANLFCLWLLVLVAIVALPTGRADGLLLQEPWLLVQLAPAPIPSDIPHSRERELRPDATQVEASRSTHAQPPAGSAPNQRDRPNQDTPPVPTAEPSTAQPSSPYDMDAIQTFNRALYGS